MANALSIFTITVFANSLLDMCASCCDFLGSVCDRVGDGHVLNALTVERFFQLLHWHSDLLLHAVSGAQAVALRTRLCSSAPSGCDPVRTLNQSMRHSRVGCALCLAATG